MSDTMEIIISAVDSASEVFQSIIGSVTSMGDSISDVVGMASSDFDSMAENVSGFQNAVSDIDSSSIEELSEELGMSTDEVERLIDIGAGLGSIPFNEASAGADELEQEVTEADDAINTLNDDLGVINSSMFMQLGQQVGELGTQAEGMAQDINTAAISVGQLATNASIAEPQMISLINNISNATFPQSEAMAYVEALNQMGVSADKLGASATNMDRINDATGIGYDKVVKLTQGLQSMGISADNLPSSFNAIAFAQANVTGGADTLQRTLMRQASTINEYGLNVDQVVLIMEKLSAQGISTTKMGTELSSVLKENDGDIRAIEESLGMESGALENAASKTGEYEGQLQRLADEEAEHKTILDQLGAAWEDVSLSIGQFMTPFLGVIGLLGQVGSFGLQVKGLKELYSLTKRMTEIEIIDSAVKSGKAAIMSVVTAATTLYGLAIGVLTGEIGLAAAATAAWNAILAVNPVMLVVLALAALVAIIYEVGKAFGWWTDVSSMLDAIKAGVTEMWEAFINHPDVQAAIQAISNAWNTLSSAVGEAWNAVLEFFNLTGGGEFDILHAMIDGIGEAWNNIREPVMAVIDIFTTIISTVWDVLNGNMSVTDGIYNVWNSLSSNIPVILSALFNAYVTIWTSIWNFVIGAVSNIVNGIISYMSQIPGIVFEWLNNARLRIIAQFNAWITLARSRLTTFVNGIITRISQLPGKIYNKLYSVVSNIRSAIQSWINTAKEQVSSMVSTVVSTLSGLPGEIASALGGVADAIAKPFQDAYNYVATEVEKIKQKAEEIPVIGGLFAAGETYDDEPVSNTNTTQEIINATENSNSPIKVEEEIHLILDLRNVPSGIDEQLLIDAVTSKGVVSALVNNRDFQSLDAKVKERLLLKGNRSLGV